MVRPRTRRVDEGFAGEAVVARGDLPAGFGAGDVGDGLFCVDGAAVGAQGFGKALQQFVGVDVLGVHLVSGVADDGCVKDREEGGCGIDVDGAHLHCVAVGLEGVGVFSSADKQDTARGEDVGAVVVVGAGEVEGGNRRRGPPVGLPAGKVVLAEFGYGGKLLPSVPTWIINGTKPTRAAWFMKDSLLPNVYWNQMLKGKEFLAKPEITLK